jgi:hypothetical protein
MINMKFGGSIGGETALLNSNRIQSGWGYQVGWLTPKTPVFGAPSKTSGLHFWSPLLFCG